MSVWVIGAGGMAVDYARVLSALSSEFSVIGRGEASAAKFEAAHNLAVARGGLERNFDRLGAPRSMIVAVGVESLAAVTELALQRGVRRILVEKPAGLDVAQVQHLGDLAARHDAEVFVAYNRRFFSSVRTARRLIEEDGGVTSFTFEFTEWSHEIEKLKKADGVKENWVLANSSHVLDLAFHLAGEPRELHAIRSGSLQWHPAGAVFGGSGRTSTGALFSYHANWASAGRWGVELNTARRRLILRPMEQLQEMMRGSVTITTLTTDDSEIDQRFKPGLYRQVEAFLTENASASLCDLSQHLRLIRYYANIAGYDSTVGSR